MIPERPDPDTILDKKAHEQAIADDLAGRLRMAHSDLGEYTITVTGAYPDTRLAVSGRNVRTGAPMDADFALWELWREWGTANGTATVIYAQLAN